MTRALRPPLIADNIATWHRALRDDPGLQDLFSDRIPAIARAGDALLEYLPVTGEIFGHWEDRFVFSSLADLYLGLGAEAFAQDRSAQLAGVTLTLAPLRREQDRHLGDPFARPWVRKMEDAVTDHAASARLKEWCANAVFADMPVYAGRDFELIVVDVALPLENTGDPVVRAVADRRAAQSSDRQYQERIARLERNSRMWERYAASSESTMWASVDRLGARIVVPAQVAEIAFTTPDVPILLRHERVHLEDGVALMDHRPLGTAMEELRADHFAIHSHPESYVLTKGHAADLRTVTGIDLHRLLDAHARHRGGTAASFYLDLARQLGPADTLRWISHGISDRAGRDLSKDATYLAHQAHLRDLARREVQAGRGAALYQRAKAAAAAPWDPESRYHGDGGPRIADYCLDIAAAYRPGVTPRGASPAPIRNGPRGQATKNAGQRR